MASADPSAQPWSTGQCMVLFTAPWCGHCKSFKNTWSEFRTALKASHPDVRVLQVDSEKHKAHVDAAVPAVFGYPTVRAYKDGELVEEFEQDRTTDALRAFTSTHFDVVSQKAGARRSRARRSRSRRQNRRRSNQRGGGGVAADAATYFNAIGEPYDVPSKVLGGEQWTGPYDAAPPAPYNGGLYGGPPASGPWASIPVTPTAAKMIHENLRSANPPPGATSQYPTAATHRPGNSWSAMPGVSSFAKQGTGPHRILGTGDFGGGKRRRRARKGARRSSRRSRGGLNLRSANMDDGAPFHPEWTEGGQQGGRRSSRRSSRRSRGGLNLRSANMDEGAPFHPEWTEGR